jgi:hypothetical protein
VTADEIRALYVETLARAQRAMDLDRDWTGKERPQWDGCSERMRDEYRTYVTPMVTALAEADLLPTRQEEAVGYHGEIGRCYSTAWKVVGEMVDGTAKYAAEVTE